MATLSRDIILLAIGQALSSTVVSLLTSVSSLSGSELASYESLSTVPVTATVCGTLLMIYPASTIMGRLGRRGGFLLKSVIGIAGGLICAASLILKSFSILIFGAFLLGMFNAFSQYYRFAAIDASKSPDMRAQAVAIVTGAGIVGGIFGPFLGSHFSKLFDVAFAGSFFALAVVCVAIAISQIFLSPELGRDQPRTTAPVRSGFAPSYDFYAASTLCAIGFSIMTLTMNAVPLSLAADPLCSSSTTIVLQTHFIAMYAPSLFNTYFVRYVGIKGLIAFGLLAFGLMAMSAQIFPSTPLLYAFQLAMSGLGWNFVFNGGTLLVASTYPPEQKTKAQGINSLIVYGANVVASLAAGALVAKYNWPVVNLACIPIILIGFVLLFSGELRRAHAGSH